MSDATNTTFTCDERIGISFVAQSACLSFAAVVSLLGYVAFNAFYNRATWRRHYLRSHLDLYLIGLLLSDLIQAVGGIMDIKWISHGGVFQGPFCTAQGVLEQFGDVGVALCSIAIATHTFAELILRWKEPRTFTIPLIVLGLYVIFLTLIVGVGFAVHRHSVYYGNTTFWCWIRKEFISDGIGLEYLWLWIAAAMNLSLYIPVFLALKRIIIVEPTDQKWLRYRVIWTTKEQRVLSRAQEDGPVNPRRMLYYPAVYIVTVLPIAVVRIHAFVSSAVPFAATVFSGVLFSASGFFNVIVYTNTRPALLRPNGPATDVPAMSKQPKVFFYPDPDPSENDLHLAQAEGEESHQQERTSFEMGDIARHRLTIHTRDLDVQGH
ncbi:hypothetical protein K439DRAFT_1040933 [Ramaria rubella]|nr:hypothetical protein K439DRAFT_1040933 [Ramaria rubella]